MKKILFYNRNQFFNFKRQQLSMGAKLLSISQFLSSERIGGLDNETDYYVDLSALAGFIKSNDTQMLNFEQLFNSFNNNITFICDSVYENDIKYLLRYVFDDFANIDVEADETVLDQEDKTIVEPATNLP